MNLIKSLSLQTNSLTTGAQNNRNTSYAAVFNNFIKEVISDITFDTKTPKACVKKHISH